VKRALINIFQVVFIFVVIFGGLTYFEYIQQKNERKEQFSQISLYQQNNDKLIKVLGKTDKKKIQHESAQYLVQEITLGGETLMAMTADDKSEEIIISNLQGKLYRSDEDDEMNYYTSWQSNKPTFSTIEYKAEQDSDFKKIEESNFGYIHAFTLPNVHFSNVYQYIIKSKDRWGREISSGQFVFYTGAPEASFFDLLESSFQDVFGWMAK